jgi:hypothetical protein
MATVEAATDLGAFIRPDGKEKITGSGRYAADLSLTGQLPRQIPLRRPHARCHRFDPRRAGPRDAGRLRGADLRPDRLVDA